MICYLFSKKLNTSIFWLYHRYNPIMKLCRHLYAMRHLCHVFCSTLSCSSDHKFWQQNYNLQNNTISIKLNKDSIDKCKRFLSNLVIIRTDWCLWWPKKGSTSLFVIRHRLFRTKATYPIIRLQIGLDNVDDLITDLNNALITTE